MSQKLWKSAVFVALLSGLPGIAAADDTPPASVAANYMNNRLGGVSNLKLSNCDGGANKQSCVAAYNRSYGPQRFYEEVTVHFQKTPSGWNVTGYDHIKTENL